MKQKLVHAFSEYGINVIYLMLFSVVFAVARRLTLAHYNIYAEDYFTAPIKALVIGKVIMIFAFLNINSNFENKPLTILLIQKQ